MATRGGSTGSLRHCSAPRRRVLMTAPPSCLSRLPGIAGDTSLEVRDDPARVRRLSHHPTRLLWSRRPGTGEPRLRPQRLPRNHRSPPAGRAAHNRVDVRDARKTDASRRVVVGAEPGIPDEHFWREGDGSIHDVDARSIDASTGCLPARQFAESVETRAHHEVRPHNTTRGQASHLLRLELAI